MNPKEAPVTEEALSTQLPDYKTEIVELIRGQQTPPILRQRLARYHENDIASAMELLSAEERRRLYRVLDTPTLACVLEYAEDADLYLEELGIRKQVEVLSVLELSVAVEHLRNMEKNRRDSLLELMSPETQRELRVLFAFDEDEIGSRMTTNYVTIRQGLTVRQAMRELVAQAAENDNISTLFVIDENELLVGAINLQRLIIARESDGLDSITVTTFPYVYANELIEDCIERIRKYAEDSIPVLDRENRLCGVLTSQEVADLVDDEMSDDYAKLAGLSAEEDLREPLIKSIGKRLPWLIILLGLGMLVSGVVGLFDSVVTELPMIVSFQSLVLGMAGNAGTQSLAVTIRVLMDEQISGTQKLRLIWKEARVGLFNGLILCIASFLIIGLYLYLLRGQTAALSFSVSLCTGIALLFSVLLSGISGTVIPLLFKKLKIDPAVASGPLITTVNDLVAVVSYYGLAALLLLSVSGL